MSDRQIVLDTETTGLDPKKGHRIIEIGCVELVNRRLTGERFHVYINPNREVEADALAVHGLSNEFLADKPVFKAVYNDFFQFIEGAELIIHNAPFDVGFIDCEFQLLDAKHRLLNQLCKITDSLVLARRQHPGQRNSLDALCQRYMIDNSDRDLHGALLDAELLAQVYLAMTGGQTHLFTEESQAARAQKEVTIRRLAKDRPPLRVIQPTEAELAAHNAYFED